MALTSFTAAGYGRLRPSFSSAATPLPETTAVPSVISPHSTMAATDFCPVGGGPDGPAGGAARGSHTRTTARPVT